MKLKLFFIVLLVFFDTPITSAKAVESGIARELLKTVENATAMVVVNGKYFSGSGSAFCVHESGIFITNQHVVEEAITIQLILNSGSENERRIPAYLLREDKTYDLAVLAVKNFGERSYPNLPIPYNDELEEGQNAVVVGFPFGFDKVTTKGFEPKPTVTYGTLAKLHKQNNRTELVEFSVIVNPGNSGGPVFDERGRIIAVIIAHKPDSTVTYAIPIHRVRKILEPPLLYMPPSQSYKIKSLREPVAIRTLYLTFSEAKLPNTLYCKVEGQPMRKYHMLIYDENNFYQGDVVLSSEDGPHAIETLWKNETNEIRGSVKDFILPGFENRWYSDLSELRFGNNPLIKFHDGNTYKQELIFPEYLSIKRRYSHNKKYWLTPKTFSDWNWFIENKHYFNILVSTNNQFNCSNPGNYDCVSTGLLISIEPQATQQIDSVNSPINLGTDEWQLENENLIIKAGNHIQSNIKIRGAQNPLTFELINGPIEMMLTKSGLINWVTPSIGQIEPVQIVFLATDSSGQNKEFTMSITLPIAIPASKGFTRSSDIVSILEYTARYFRDVGYEKKGKLLKTPFGLIENDTKAYIQFNEITYNVVFKFDGYHLKLLPLTNASEQEVDTRVLFFP